MNGMSFNSPSFNQAHELYAQVSRNKEDVDVHVKYAKCLIDQQRRMDALGFLTEVKQVNLFYREESWLSVVEDLFESWPGTVPSEHAMFHLFIINNLLCEALARKSLFEVSLLLRTMNEHLINNQAVISEWGSDVYQEWIAWCHLHMATLLTRYQIQHCGERWMHPVSINQLIHHCLQISISTNRLVSNKASINVGTPLRISGSQSSHGGIASVIAHELLPKRSAWRLSQTYHWLQHFSSKDVEFRTFPASTMRDVMSHFLTRACSSVSSIIYFDDNKNNACEDKDTIFTGESISDDMYPANESISVTKLMRLDEECCDEDKLDLTMITWIVRQHSYVNEIGDWHVREEAYAILDKVILKHFHVLRNCVPLSSNIDEATNPESFSRLDVLIFLLSAAAYSFWTASDLENFHPVALCQHRNPYCYITPQQKALWKAMWDLISNRSGSHLGRVRGLLRMGLIQLRLRETATPSYIPILVSVARGLHFYHEPSQSKDVYQSDDSQSLRRFSLVALEANDPVASKTMSEWIELFWNTISQLISSVKAPSSARKTEHSNALNASQYNSSFPRFRSINPSSVDGSPSFGRGSTTFLFLLDQLPSEILMNIWLEEASKIFLPKSNPIPVQEIKTPTLKPQVVSTPNPTEKPDSTSSFQERVIHQVLDYNKYLMETNQNLQLRLTACETRLTEVQSQLEKLRLDHIELMNDVTMIHIQKEVVPSPPAVSSASQVVNTEYIRSMGDVISQQAQQQQVALMQQQIAAAWSLYPYLNPMLAAASAVYNPSLVTASTAGVPTVSSVGLLDISSNQQLPLYSQMNNFKTQMNNGLLQSHKGGNVGLSFAENMPVAVSTTTFQPFVTTTITSAPVGLMSVLDSFSHPTSTTPLKPPTTLGGFLGETKSSVPLFLNEGRSMKTLVAQPEIATPSVKEEDLHPEEFVPTQDFQPVVELPIVEQVNTGEEGWKKIFSERGTLYRFDKKETQWKTRGTGDIHILTRDNQSSNAQKKAAFRLIMRREQTKKLCANHFISQHMTLTRANLGKHAVTWAAKDFSDDVLKDELFAARFKEESQMKAFEDTFNECVAKLKLVVSQGKEKESSVQQTQKNADFMAKFQKKPGSWTCNGCYLIHDAEVRVCPACNTTKPVESSNKSTEKSSTLGSNDQSKLASNKIPVSSSNAAFLEKSTLQPGCWSCDNCYLMNGPDVMQCPTCNHRKPLKELTTSSGPVTTTGALATSFDKSSVLSQKGTKPEEMGAFKFGSFSTAELVPTAHVSGTNVENLMDKFKPKPGSWCCNGCYLTHDATVTVCPCCSTSKPGSDTRPPATAESVFKFTTPVAATNSNTSSNFNFQFTSLSSGSSVTATTTESTLFGGFQLKPKFSQSSSSVNVTTASTTESSLFGGFQFKPIHSSASQSSSFSTGTGSFQFKPETPAKQTTQSSQNLPFSFSQTEPLKGTSKQSTIPVATTTNASLFSITQPSIDAKGTTSLFSNLNLQPPTGSFSGLFSGGTSTPNFSFSTNTIATSQQTAEASQHNASVAEESDENVLEEETDHIYFKPVLEQLPERVEVNTGEENDETMFCERARLYRWCTATSEWKERGTGEMKLLRNKNSNQTRVVMRREQVLKVCCNHCITSGMQLRPMTGGNNRAWTWLAADFSETLDTPEHVTLAIKFKDQSTAERFRDLFEKAVLEKSPVKDIRKSPVVVPKEDEANGTNQTEDEDVVFVREEIPYVTEDQIARARALMLHDTYFAFENDPDYRKSESEESSVENKTDQVDRSDKIITEFPVPSSISDDVKPQTEASANLFDLKNNGGNFFSSFATNASGLDFSALAQSAKNANSFQTNNDSPFSWSSMKGQLFSSTQKTGGTGDSKGKEGQCEEADTSAEGGDHYDPEYEPVIELPELVPRQTGEEEDECLFERRARLYRFSDGQWKERGIGSMKILVRKLVNKDASQSVLSYRQARLLMRRDQILKLCCNHSISDVCPKFTPFASGSANTACWIAQDFSEGEGKTENLAIKFKTEEDMVQFKAVVSEIQEKIKSESTIENSS